MEGAAAGILGGAIGVVFVVVALCGSAVRRGRLHIFIDRWIERQNARGQLREGHRLVEAAGERQYYPLADAYPALKTSLRLVPLCSLPTPLARLEQLERALLPRGSGLKLLVKDDGRSCERYGGNKPRKLELLLGQALLLGRDTVVALGTRGSHSVLATAVHSRSVGLRCTAHLAPQSPAARVSANVAKIRRVLAGQSDGDGKAVAEHRSALGAALGAAACRLNNARCFLCPTGATSPLSTVGFVNAAFELADDLRRAGLGDAPAVRVYVPSGSGGTAVGLLVGIKAHPALRGRVRVVALRSGSFRPVQQALALFEETVALLRRLTGGTFPEVSTTKEELAEVSSAAFAGAGYGKSTPEAEEAEELFARDGIPLEATYTGKAAACLVHDARCAPSEEVGVWIFWQTNSAT